VATLLSISISKGDEVMRFLVILLAVTVLAACGGQQVTAAGPGVIAPSQSIASKVAPDLKRCGGTNGVSVSPCPLIISKKSGGFAWFNVKGPNVGASYLRNYQYQGYCYNKKGAELCYVQNLASPPTYWQASSGSDCGKAKPLEFLAFGSDGFVGYGYLTVINRDCS
jgi:hypothetical protein